MKKLERRWDSLFGLVAVAEWKPNQCRCRVPNQRDTMMWRRREACFAEKRVEGDDDEDDMEEFIYLCGGIARIFPVVGEGGEEGGEERRRKNQ